MAKKMSWIGGVLVALALGLGFAGAPLAQTTTTVEARIFEVISVDGNRLVLRDDRGTNEYTVPSDFRLTVDGKKMPVSELKAGMKGTATVTTTTTVTPVVVTEIRKGVVLSVGPGSVVVRDDTDGLRKRFTQGQLNDRGIQILKDGRAILISQLNQGDEIAATIISQAAPVVVTEQEVQASLAQSQSKTESTSANAASSAGATQSAAPASAPAPAAEPSASAPTESSGMGTSWYVLIAVIVAAVLFFVTRRRKAQ